MGCPSSTADSVYCKATWDTGNEICTRFDAPWLVAGPPPPTPGLPSPTFIPPNLQPPICSLCSIYVRAVEDAADARLQQLQAEIDETVYDLYEISAEDRALIERELGERPPGAGLAPDGAQERRRKAPRARPAAGLLVPAGDAQGRPRRHPDPGRGAWPACAIAWRPSSARRRPSAWRPTSRACWAGTWPIGSTGLLSNGTPSSTKRRPSSGTWPAMTAPGR